MRYFIVDAFTEELFRGNQAGVCLLDAWLDASILHPNEAVNYIAKIRMIESKFQAMQRFTWRVILNSINRMNSHWKRRSIFNYVF